MPVWFYFLSYRNKNKNDKNNYISILVKIIIIINNINKFIDGIQ